MDNFLKSNSISIKSTIDDVAYNCIKILDWIYKLSQAAEKLSYKDVENIGKGIVYLNSCYKLFEEELPRRLVQEFPIYEKHVRTFFGNGQTHRYKSISNIIQRVTQTEDGLENFLYLDLILNTIYETHNEEIALEYNLRDFEKVNGSASKAYVIIQQIFQLPKEQIDVAIERTLNYIPFNIIGFVFCEPQSSFYIDACWILAHKIYEHLVNGSISTLFIRSLYQSVSVSPKGNLFYLQCLRNGVFSNGIIAFFIRALTHISKDDRINDMDIERDLFESHRLKHVFHLIWAALQNSSPCHMELYQRIADAGVRKCFLIMNSFDRIYKN